MVEFGFFLASEEHGPLTLVELARVAEDAGFRSACISDHFHPWVGAQGQSAFVWTLVGGIGATTQLRVTTAVTCPIMRIHPAIVAHAAATAAALMPGRFRLGVGTGERLDEHVLGDHWPPPAVRLEMLEEAIDVMRALWTGKLVTHDGAYYTVEGARLYTVPDQLPWVLVSAFEPKAMRLAARVGDGYVGVTPTPTSSACTSGRAVPGPRSAISRGAGPPASARPSTSRCAGRTRPCPASSPKSWRCHPTSRLPGRW